MLKHTFIYLTDKPKKVLHKRGHAKGKVPTSVPDYTTINRRINRLDIKIKDDGNKESKDNYIIIAIDSTGIKVTNREREDSGLEMNGTLGKGI